MDKEYEESLVKGFFKKKMQDRIIFELSSEKKRRNALDRLCHNFEKILNENYIIEIPKPNSDYNKILNLLESHGANDNCYVISYNKDIDGQFLLLSSALQKVVGFGMPSIVSCLPDKLLYFESEQVYGSPKRFILKKE
jgi:hypothetical protein